MLRTSHYEKLNDREKVVYKQIVDGIERGQGEIAVSEAANERVIEAVSLAHPEFYYVDFRRFAVRQTNNETFLSVEYLYTENEKAQIEKRLAEIGGGFAKFRGEALLRKVHNYLVKTVKYDSEEANREKSDAESHSIVGALINGVSVCEGVAKAFSFIVSQFGIDNKIVAGTSDGEPHAWNMVVLNGNAYHIDVTNDIENFDLSCSKPCYFYYLIPDEDMRKLAEFDDEQKCSSRNENLFYKYGRVFCDDGALSDYVNALPTGARDIYFKYVGGTRESKLAEMIAQARALRNSRMQYRVDATHTIYHFTF